MKKKAELSLNVIIIAVIGLLVLVVISVVFIQRMGMFPKYQQDLINANCESNLSKCVLVNESCPEGYERFTSHDYRRLDDNPFNDLSCIKLNKEGRFMKEKEPIKNYRLKNDCELNPREDADCFCDKKELKYDEGVECIKPNTIYLKTEKCVQSHKRNPAERCGYFNRTPVYDLNNINVVGCI